MPFTVQDILDIIEKIAPADLAENWDNVGLMIGRPSDQVEGVMVGLDPDLQLLNETMSCGANLLITHHPLLFHPLHSIELENPEGTFIQQAIIHRINVVSCHTNFDSTAEGVSYSLARRLELENIAPLVASPGSEQCGTGSIGSYSKSVSTDTFVEKLREACMPPWLMGTPNRPESIQRVAVCGGSCSELAPVAHKAGAQVFVTSEVKHSTARWAEQAGLWLIDAGHFATENQAMPVLADTLTAQLSGGTDDLPIHMSKQQGSPLLLL